MTTPPPLDVDRVEDVTAEHLGGVASQASRFELAVFQGAVMEFMLDAEVPEATAIGVIWDAGNWREIVAGADEQAIVGAMPSRAKDQRVLAVARCRMAAEVAFVSVEAHKQTVGSAYEEVLNRRDLARVGECSSPRSSVPSTARPTTSASAGFWPWSPGATRMRP